MNTADLEKDNRPDFSYIDSETALNIKRVALRVENYIRTRAAMVPGEKTQAVLIGYVEEWLRGAT